MSYEKKYFSRLTQILIFYSNGLIDNSVFIQCATETPCTFLLLQTALHRAYKIVCSSKNTYKTNPSGISVPEVTMMIPSRMKIPSPS